MAAEETMELMLAAVVTAEVGGAAPDEGELTLTDGTGPDGAGRSGAGADTISTNW